MDTALHFGLSNAFMAMVLALLAASVSHLCRRPALTHALWLLVVLKLLTPPLLPVPVVWLSVPKLPMAATATLAPGPGPYVETTGSTDSEPGSPERSVPEQPSTALPSASAASSIPIGPSDPAGAVPPWAWIVGLAWAAGSAMWVALLGWRAHCFRRVLRDSRRAPPAIQERARELAQRFGVARCPAVWFVSGRVSPMLWALAGRPRLLLPWGLWSRLSGTQQDTLLAHELAHLRRRDHWVRWLELATVGFYWWHPVAWWAQHELEEAGEECCDAWVVAVLPAAADAYAEALLETVAYLSRVRAPLPVGASGAGRVHLLKRRLIMILNGTAPRALSPASRWVVLALGAVLLPLWPTWAYSQPARDREPARADRADPTPRPDPAGDESRAEAIDKARATVHQLSAELDRMKAQFEAVAGRLHEARARLARLEGRNEPLPAHASERYPSPASKAPAATLSDSPRSNHVAGPTARNAPMTQQTAPAHALGAPDGATTQVAPAFPRPMDLATTPQLDHQRDSRAANQAIDSATRRDRRGGDDYEERLRAVERKLDRLLEEFKSLRERQPSPSPEHPRR